MCAASKESSPDTKCMFNTTCEVLQTSKDDQDCNNGIYRAWQMLVTELKWTLAHPSITSSLRCNCFLVQTKGAVNCDGFIRTKLQILIIVWLLSATNMFKFLREFRQLGHVDGAWMPSSCSGFLSTGEGYIALRERQSAMQSHSSSPFSSWQASETKH